MQVQAWEYKLWAGLVSARYEGKGISSLAVFFTSCSGREQRKWRLGRSYRIPQGRNGFLQWREQICWLVGSPDWYTLPHFIQELHVSKQLRKAAQSARRKTLTNWFVSGHCLALPVPHHENWPFNASTCMAGHRDKHLTLTTKLELNCIGLKHAEALQVCIL